MQLPARLSPLRKTSFEGAHRHSNVKQRLIVPAFIDDPVTNARAPVPAVFLPAPQFPVVTATGSPTMAFSVSYKAVVSRFPVHLSLCDS